MINILKLILDEKDYKEMVILIDTEIDKLRSKLISISIENILRIMGYPNV